VDSSGWSATFSGFSALAAIITGVIAARTLQSQKQDSRDRTRPVVIAALRPGPSFTHGYLYLEVKNRGLSVAREVRVTFEPDIEDELPRGKSTGVEGPYIARRYAEPIPVMAPGQGFINIYWAARLEELGEVLTPPSVRVTVEYKDDRDRAYSDAFALEVESHKQETTANPRGSNDLPKRTAQAIEAATWEVWRSR
jgi:hypothetical protein